MVTSDISRLNVAYYMVIVLCVFQVITFVALLIFWMAFNDLKKNIRKYKDNLPLVNITSTPPTLPPLVHPETSSAAIGSWQNPEFNEVIERMPTPNPERRHMVNSIAIETKRRNESTEKYPRFMSFSSIDDLSRDSGIGSSSVRNQSNSSDANAVFQERAGSLHEDSRTTSNASCSSRDTTVFQEKVSVHEDQSRTTSIASNLSRDTRVFQKRAFSDSHPVSPEKTLVNQEQRTLSASYSSRVIRPTSLEYQEVLQSVQHGLDNGNQNHHTRLQTMYIEDIDVGTTSPTEKRYKRASQILNENTVFINRGFSDASESAQRRAPLASEEGSLSSDVHNVDENANEVEEEVYENQAVIEKHRLSMKLDSTSM